MDSTEKNINAGIESGQTLGELVLSTAFATLKWILIIAGLAATLFCCLFPYQAMAVYRSLNNYEKALEYCDVCLDNAEGKESEYSALLVNAINISSTIVSGLTDKIPYADTNKDKLRLSAEKLAAYTYKYKSLPAGVRSARSKAVDAYNLSVSPKEMHTQVYNFDAYAAAKSVYAESLLNVISAGISAIKDFIVAEADIDGMIIAAAEVNAYIGFESYRKAYAADAPGNAMYGFISASDFTFMAENIGYTFGLIKSDGIDKLYAVETLAVLANNLKIAALMYRQCKDDMTDEIIEAIEQAKTIDINGRELTLSNYYTVLYNNYIK